MDHNGFDENFRLLGAGVHFTQRKKRLLQYPYRVSRFLLKSL